LGKYSTKYDILSLKITGVHQNMKYKIDELLNMARIEETLHIFSRLGGFDITILNPNGEILLTVGDKHICTSFPIDSLHSEPACLYNDYHKLQQLGIAQQLVMRRCAHGFIDMMAPVMVSGKHLATIAVGPFRLKNDEFSEQDYRKQAEENGWDVEAYLQSVDQIVVSDQQQIDLNSQYLTMVGGFLSELSLSRSNELKALQEQMLKLEKRLGFLLRQIPGNSWVTDDKLRITMFAGDNLETLGIEADDIIGKTVYELYPSRGPNSLPITMQEKALQGQSVNFIMGHLGYDFECRIEPFRDELGNIIGTLGLAFDITERTKANLALAESEGRFRDLFENAADIIFTLDLKGNIISVNRSGERLTGFTREVLSGMPFSELVAPWGRDCLKQAFADLNETNFEIEIIDRDGQLKYLDVRTRLLIKDGKPVGVQGNARNITVQKKAQMELKLSEERLAESEARLRALSEASFEGIIINENGICLDANQQAADLFKTKVNYMKNQSIFDFVAPESKETLRSYVNTNYELPFELNIIMSDGSRRLIEVQNRAFVYQGRTVIGSALRDLSFHQYARKEIERKNKNLEVLFYNVPDGVVRGDLEQRIIEVNNRFVEMFGFKKEECVGHYLNELLIPEDLQPEYDAHSSAALEGKATIKETRRKTKDGRIIDVIVKVLPIPNEGHYVLYTDISENKAVEKVIQQQIKDLEAKNSEMERFTYTVSHDLRSPLVTIKGFSTMILEDLKEGNLERIQGDLQRVINAANKMDELLQDLLELSRIGRMLNQYTRISMNNLVNDVAELLNGPLKAAGVELVIEKDLPEVWGDQSRLREVIQNLIENAIKFRGEQSNPVIRVGYHNYAEEHVFFVQDNGIGIDNQYIDKIFGLFDKLDNHSEGNGIGLALVKRIVEFHEGRIWVESPGKGYGSTFYFALPKHNVQN